MERTDKKEGGDEASKRKPHVFMYALDLFIPLVKFRQEEFWVPAWQGGLVKSLREKNWGMLGANIICLYYWCHIAAGWILSTLFVVGLTGTMRS